MCHTAIFRTLRFVSHRHIWYPLHQGQPNSASAERAGSDCNTLHSHIAEGNRFNVLSPASGSIGPASHASTPTVLNSEHKQRI